MYCGTSLWLDSFNEKPMAGLFALNKPTGSHFDAFKSDMDQDIKPFVSLSLETNSFATERHPKDTLCWGFCLVVMLLE